MTTARLLVRLAYAGERLAGSQTQKTHATAQGLLHSAVAALCRVASRDVRTAPSSRTDAGVHALCNPCLVDAPLQTTAAGSDSEAAFGQRDADYFTGALNSILAGARAPVTVLDTTPVSRGFCARRHARHRTYLYRLAAMKRHHSPEVTFGPADGYIHPVEHNRCYAMFDQYLQSHSVAHKTPTTNLSSPQQVLGSIDRSRFEEAAAKLVGTHNVASFMAPLKLRDKQFKPEDERKIVRHNQQINRHRRTMRTMHDIRLTNGAPLLGADPSSDRFDYYDVLFTGSSFVHQQIRRTMAVLVAVAQHRLPLRYVDDLLQRPYVNHVCRLLPAGGHIAPAGGLYLAHVHYDPVDYHEPRPYLVHDWDVTFAERMELAAQERRTTTVSDDGRDDDDDEA